MTVGQGSTVVGGDGLKSQPVIRNIIKLDENKVIYIYFFIYRHCLNEAHAPCACQLWSKWLEKIAEMMPKIPTTQGNVWSWQTHC